MNIALGFGSSEAEVEAGVRIAFEEFVAAAYSKQTTTYITDEMVKEVAEWAQARSAESQAASKAHDEAENPPGRYSRWWAHLTSSASDLVLIVTFHHINRRNPLSADGWALMRSKQLFHISVSDLPSPSSQTTV